MKKPKMKINAISLLNGGQENQITREKAKEFLENIVIASRGSFKFINGDRTDMFWFD